MLDRWTKNDENLKAICYLLIFAFVQTKILLLAHDYAFNCPPQMKSQNSSLQLGAQEGDEYSGSLCVDFGFKALEVMTAAQLLDDAEVKQV